MEENKKHESYGIINVSKFSSNGSQFFGSDLSHNGGVSITIQRGEKSRKLSSEWFYGGQELIRVEMSHNQFVDAITSGMNTSGVPCTIKCLSSGKVEQIDHIENKREQFSNEMIDTNKEYLNKIDALMEKIEGNIGKRKSEEIKHDLGILRSHIGSNTNFVMKCFNESIDKSVTEAKHSIANYIDHKVNALGIEALRDQLQISIEE